MSQSDDMTPGFNDSAANDFTFEDDLYPDLLAQHIHYCLEDLKDLCDLAGTSATYKEDRHTRFAETLALLRQHNAVLLPKKPLDAQRLAFLAGAESIHLFQKDFETSAATGEIDSSIENARQKIIEYVLRDSSDVILAAAKWFSKGNNASYGHWAAENNNVFKLFRPGLIVVNDMRTGNELHRRINEALVLCGLKPDPDRTPSSSETRDTKNQTSKSRHLRLIK